MAGRHHPAGGARRGHRSVLAVAVIAVLAILVGTGTWLLSRHKPAAEAKAGATPTKMISSPQCSGSDSITLSLLVASSVALPVNQIAADWTAANPSVGGKCVQVELSSDASDQQELNLVSGAAASTSIWIPDSSTWAQRLVVDRRSVVGPKLGIAVLGSVASSPLVAVTSPSRAAQLTAKLADPDFDPLVGAAIPEPVHNSEGLLDLLSETPAAGAAQLTTAQSTLSRLLTFSRSALAAPLNGFDALAGGGTGDNATFVASEQAVVAANQQRGDVVAVALYPTRPTLGLDFPVVRLSHAADDPALDQAADSFEKALRSMSAQSYFTQAGFRTPDGTPIPQLGAAAGVTPDLVPPATAPTSAQTLNVVRWWNAAVSDSNTLAVIDLSGSMADPAGNGQSKVTVATDAANRAVAFFPDTSALGLWVFSSDQGGNQPWAELVSLGGLGDKVGTGTRRQALLAADKTMAGRVHGGTALYDTVLASYQQVKTDFDPSKNNTVVLMTDGRNEDTSSTRTLNQLLGELESATDPAMPIRIITIGIGSGADSAALTQISAATAGKYYSVQNAADITGVFLDAVASRQ